MKMSIYIFKKLFVSGFIVLSGALAYSVGELVGENFAKSLENKNNEHITLEQLKKDDLTTYAYLYNQINSEYQKGGSDRRFCEDFTTLNEVYPKSAAKYMTKTHLQLVKNCRVISNE